MVNPSSSSVENKSSSPRGGRLGACGGAPAVATSGTGLAATPGSGALVSWLLMAGISSRFNITTWGGRRGGAGLGAVGAWAGIRG